MKKAFLICLILVFGVMNASQSTYAQNKQPGWFSLQRLGIDFGGSYHFNPWQNYNKVMEKVSREIRLGNELKESTGFYDKINGDASLWANVSYQISGPWKAILLGSYSATAATFEVRPNPSTMSSYDYQMDFQQEFDFTVWSAGFGIAREWPIAQNTTLETLVALEHHAAKFSYSYDLLFLEFGSPSDLPGGHDRLQADLTRKKWGGQVAISARRRLTGPLYASVRAIYRMVDFDNLTGPGFYFYFADNNLPFAAQLVEANNFFGIGTENSEVLTSSNSLTFGTEPSNPFLRTPAKIDFSAFGVGIGLSLEF